MNLVCKTWKLHVERKADWVIEQDMRLEKGRQKNWITLRDLLSGRPVVIADL